MGDQRLEIHIQNHGLGDAVQIYDLRMTIYELDPEVSRYLSIIRTDLYLCISLNKTTIPKGLWYTELEEIVNRKL